MIGNKYNIKYLSSFDKELQDIIYYITNILNNPNAAEKLINSIENAIYDRMINPEGFEVYISSKKRRYNWYRIYVKNFTIFYIVKDNLMIISHIFYSKRNLDDLI